MQLLLAKQLACSRMDLYLQFDRPLADDQLAPLREALRRRADGVPLQHLLGSVEFHHREFRCDPRAMIPRPETEELAELALSLLPAPATAARILDMGCGSGVLGLTLAAERPAALVTLADVSPDALALARDNAAALAITNVSFVASDLFTTVHGPFDLIVANLPYVPERDRPSLAPELAHDPPLALFGGPDGLDLIRRFVPAAASQLAPAGTLALEIGHDQASHVATLLEQSGLAHVTIHPDLSGIPRFPTARRPPAPAPSSQQ